VLGYGAAMIVAHFIVQASERAGAVILMPWVDEHRHAVSGSGDVRGSGAGFDQQGDADRSGDGFFEE